MDARPPNEGRPQRLQRWLDRVARRYEDTDSVYSVPSWGLSLLLHALLLLILALLIRAGQGTSTSKDIQGAIAIPAIGDLSSLVEAEQAGDPFTKEQSPDPPSIGLEPIEPLAQFAAQPMIPTLERFAPELAGPRGNEKGGVKILTDLSGGGALRGGPQFPSLSADVSAPFSGRQGLDRAQLVRREGGTVHSEKAVEEGLAWIVRHQAADGSWSLNFQDHCQADPCPPQRAMESDTAATGLALLPLLGAGYIHNVKCRHQDTVRRGLEWLVQHQQPSGDLFTGPPGIAYMYSHAIGAMTLCEAYGLSRDSNLKEPARRALAFIIDSQNTQTGGWRYAPGQAGDTSVFGWQIFALRSGHLAGLTIPRTTLKGCSDWLNSAATDSKKILYAYQPGQDVSPVMTAEALLARQLLGWPRNHPSLVKGAGRIAAHLESNKDRNIYYWYYATQLLHNMKNKDWEKWNPEVREGLIRAQVKDQTCANGSWDPFSPAQDRWGVTAGRLFQTSLSILTLEVYYRYLPLYRTADTEGLEANATAPEAKKAQPVRQP
ncbi:terpene cyclase/mutase family protein [Aquisphaera insulae]|uniref:terpene cyclase/mutase family protein n=1 Tax=Aquisphaera insulae TaxID=2712864 RepID=UPI0013EA6464|nr:terpene cyclase/mutase family protein [Aquisphaera insulae]